MPGRDGRGPIGPGRGRGGGYGTPGTCVCPECGYEMEHRRGQACNRIKCPKCGAYMTRGQ